MLRAAGIFLVALGCIWALQGLGALGWPADSVMLGDKGWALRGAGLALLGAGLIGLVQWCRRR
jgi:hypothetical protein